MSDDVEQQEQKFQVESGAADREPVQQAPVEAPVAADPEPAPTAAAEDAKEKPLDPWIADRIARAKRQRDDEKRRADAYEQRTSELERIVGKLKAGKDPDVIDPQDYADYGEYQAAIAAKNAPPVHVDPEFVEALGDLQEAVTGADQALWDEATKVGEDGAPAYKNISQSVVIALADAPDPAAALRALMALSDEQRQEIASMSARRARKAVAALKAEAPAKAATAARDATGKFTAAEPPKKQSSAPPPIEPVQSGATPDRPLADIAKSGDFRAFEARRNAEMTKQPGGW